MTLLEVLVTMAILSLLCLVLASFIDTVRRTWTSTSAKIEQFREAREGFECLTRRLSQATLNTYWDYARDSSGNPTQYTRQSELRFLSGPGVAGDASSSPARPTHAVFFQAPLGSSTNSALGSLANLLNTVGYFIELNNDGLTRPPFLTIPTRTRYRLMELVEPSDSLTLYQFTSGKNSQGSFKNPSYVGTDWFSVPLQKASGRVVADNIIALVILPRFSASEKKASGGLFNAEDLAPDYRYDSTKASGDPETNTKNQLPPILQVAMVAIDEKSAGRMDSAAVQSLGQKTASLFSKASQWQADLYRDVKNGDLSQDPSLEAYLIRNRINYRIFTTNISLKAAKWSREQAN